MDLFDFGVEKKSILQNDMKNQNFIDSCGSVEQHLIYLFDTLLCLNSDMESKLTS